MLQFLPYTLCVALITLAGAFLYRELWRRFWDSQATPTGFGVFIALTLLVASIVARAPGNIVIAFAILTTATAIYWLDDLIGLSAGVRMLISFLTGVGLSVLMLWGEDVLNGPLFVMLSIGGGILSLVLTNVVNFYDGADLNLASFIILTAVAILLFGPRHEFMIASALGCVAFCLPFAFLNSRPKTIYLGDAGSFAFAGFLIIVIFSYFRSGEGTLGFAMIPAALPIVDVLYVLIVRVANGEDLLTRNYLHLYQKLQLKYPGFGYLAPQFLNWLLVTALALFLHTLGLQALWATALAALLITPPHYLLSRRLLLSEFRTS